MRAISLISLLLLLSCSKSEPHNEFTDETQGLDLPEPKNTVIIFSKPKYFESDDIVAFVNKHKDFRYEVTINNTNIPIDGQNIIRYEINNQREINIRTIVSDNEGNSKVFEKIIKPVREGNYKGLLSISESDLKDVVGLHQSDTYKGVYSESIISVSDSLMAKFGGPAQYEFSNIIGSDLFKGLHGLHKYKYNGTALLSIEVELLGAVSDHSLVGDNVYLNNAIKLFGEPKFVLRDSGTPIYDFSNKDFIINFRYSGNNDTAYMTVIKR